uniref:Uncharacterized protein n=1 Tax=Xanthomonas vasicola pv. vasculorum NCPPB 890 TaxID=1184265 RepID=A0A836P324_XANVA
MRADAIGHARQPATGQRAYLPIGFDHANTIVVGVGDIHAPLRIHRHANRPIEAHLCRCAVAIPRHTIAGKRGHFALRRQLADGMVTGIGDVQIAGRIEHDSRRCIERCRHADAIGKAFAATGQRVHMAISTQAVDAVIVAAIGDVQRAVRIGR